MENKPLTASEMAKKSWEVRTQGMNAEQKSAYMKKVRSFGKRRAKKTKKQPK